MTLIELYNLKLNEYKTNGLRERPWKLLAMLLLSEKDKYEPLRSQGEFYNKYKDEIDKRIIQVEQDFNFTKEDITEYIEETVICDDYEDQKIWFVFNEGFGALSWGLSNRQEKTGEEIYSQYFDTDDLIKPYNIEQKAIANNIAITELDNLLDKVLENPRGFYKKVAETLTLKEKIFIIEKLEHKNCSNCSNECCSLPYNKKIGYEDGKPVGSSCGGWYNSELIGKSKVLRKTNIYELNKSK